MRNAYFEAAKNVIWTDGRWRRILTYLGIGKKGKSGCSISETASGYMNQAIQWQRKVVELHKKADSLSILTENLSLLGGYYELIQDLKSAEEAYKEAVTCAENDPSEGKEKDRALFNSKLELARFYKENNKPEEARELAGELEVMVEQGRSGVYTKEDVMELRDK
jgi:tetratricopeptide (TPR) repeat protein